MERILKITRRLLLAFVWITVGFVLGKEAALHGVKTAAPEPAGSESTGARPDRVEVYYLHATFRCATCTAIEKMTRGLLESAFGAELADGRIEWHEADFQQNEALARRFGVVSSCVVVAGIRNGRETGHQRLDEVWTLLNDPPAFEAYVGGAIRKALLPPPLGGAQP